MIKINKEKLYNNLFNELTDLVIEIEQNEEIKLNELKEDLFLLCKDIIKNHLKVVMLNEQNKK